MIYKYYDINLPDNYNYIEPDIDGTELDGWDEYYDTDFIELAHMKTIACHIYRSDFDEARTYYNEKRFDIEKIKMDDLVDQWFVQKRVFDRIELQ